MGIQQYTINYLMPIRLKSMDVYPNKSFVILIVVEDKLFWTKSKTFHDQERTYLNLFMIVCKLIWFYPGFYKVLLTYIMYPWHKIKFNLNWIIYVRRERLLPWSYCKGSQNGKTQTQSTFQLYRVTLAVWTANMILLTSSKRVSAVVFNYGITQYLYLAQHCLLRWFLSIALCSPTAHDFRVINARKLARAHTQRPNLSSVQTDHSSRRIIRLV